MAKVIIGVDPHKLSATIEVVDDHETAAGYGPVRHRQGRLRRDAQVRRRRGRSGSGRSRAATAPAGRWRSGCSRTASRSSTCRPSSPPGSGCSTPATTARPTPTTRTPIAVVAVRTTGLRVLRRRRRARGAADAGRPPRGADPAPGPDRRTGSSGCWPNCFRDRRRRTSPPLQAKAMLASVRPRDIAGKTRRRIAAEELAELVAVEAKMKKATAELKAMVLARGSQPDGPARCRTGRRRPDPGRRRRRRPVRRPQPVRVLDRHRTPGRLLR